MMRTIFALSFIAAMGCAHKPATTPAPAQSIEPAPAQAPVASAPKELTCSRDLDCGDKQLCIRNRCVDITPGLAECMHVRVYFEFNSASMRQGEQPELERSVRCLRADQALHVSIEGNADERGTEEYNLALGDKRATSVATYLKTAGVSEQQLKTVSFGEEKPLCVEHDEACWAKNRRAEVNPVSTAKKDKKKK